MKTTKLTIAQIEKLSIALAFQFKGKSIAIGCKSGYNDGNVFVGKMRFHKEHNVLDSDGEIGNKVFSKCLLNTNCWNRIDAGFNPWVFFININVERIMEFSNGQDVINKAMQIIASK
jgi:hypothetical protein